MDHNSCIDLSTAELFLQDPNLVNLSSYSSIDRFGARHLAEHFPEPLIHLGISSIDLACASELKKFQGRVSLPDLTELDEATAACLASFDLPVICNQKEAGFMIGQKLGVLDQQMASKLVSFARKQNGGIIHTGCFLEINSSACNEIVAVENMAVLSQIRKLSPDCSSILGRKKSISFLNLEEFNSADAGNFASGGCLSLILNSLKHIDSSDLEILISGNISFLGLDGIKKLNIDQAEVLSKTKNSLFLSLDGIKDLPLDVAELLVDFEGERALLGGTISLMGLSSITVELAEVFSNYKGTLLRLSPKSEMCGEVIAELSKNKQIKFL